MVVDEDVFCVEGEGGVASISAGEGEVVGSDGSVVC